MPIKNQHPKSKLAWEYNGLRGRILMGQGLIRSAYRQGWFGVDTLIKFNEAIEDMLADCRYNYKLKKDFIDKKKHIIK